MPAVAAERAREAIQWKVSPRHLTLDRFRRVPQRLRSVLGRLVGVPPEEIILGNSATFGIHLLANGIEWREGDEILLVRGDFPTNILPWIALEKLGVRIRYLDPERSLPDAGELKNHLSPSTRLFCTSHVHSFTGFTADYRALGEVCSSMDVCFVLNVSHSLGTRPFTLTGSGVDALTCVGYKWLCGPYGTGFCWVRSGILDTLNFNHAYWLAVLEKDYLLSEGENLILKKKPGPRNYDVFGTANFFNFTCWSSSVEYLLEAGIEKIETHNRSLVEKVVSGIDRNRFDLISPARGRHQSSIVVLSHHNPKMNRTVFEALERAGVDISFRKGKLRISPHLFNTGEEIDTLLDILNAM